MIRKLLAGLAASAALLAVGASAPAQAVSLLQPPVVASDSGGYATPPAFAPQGKVLKGEGGQKGQPGKVVKLDKSSGKMKASSALLTGPYYNYALARQILTGTQTSTGIAANLTVERPYVESGSGHSLAELAVQSADGQQTVEVGWRKTASGNTALFVYHWINGVGQGYQTGFTEYASTCNAAGAICPGDLMTSVPTHTQLRFQITYSGGNWWIGYDTGQVTQPGVWVGFFSGSRWSGASPAAVFTEGKVLSGYFEAVHATKVNTCTDMGNGEPTSSGTAARIGSLSITGLVGTTVNFGPTSILPSTTPTSVYSTQALDTPTTTMRAGGKGWSATGGTTGQVLNGC